MYKQFKVTNKPGYGCMKAPKTMKIWRTVPMPWNAFVIELKDMPDDSACREARIYFDDKDREALYARVNWSALMNKEEVEFQQHQWNHAALRALLLVLSATHRSDFSEYTLDLQDDRSWWGNSGSPLDGEPVGPYVPRVTDAPRRSKPPRKPLSESFIAKSTASGSHSCEPSPMRPRTLFRTSRLSEEPTSSPRHGSPIRWGSRTHPHQVADGDYICDGTGHARITAGAAAQQWGWELIDVKNDECPYAHEGKEPEHFLEDDNGLPLEPAFPISPMSPALYEAVTPVYV